jgi:UTP:GlnB (protein PII) uridylyltransferase
VNDYEFYEKSIALLKEIRDSVKDNRQGWDAYHTEVLEADALKSRLVEAQASLKERSTQVGVACSKHDLTHSLVCGHCHEDAVQVIRQLVVALRGWANEGDRPKEDRDAIAAAAPYLEVKP